MNATNENRLQRAIAGAAAFNRRFEFWGAVKTLVACALLSASAASAQPLSIVRNADSTFSVHGADVSTDPHTLQVTENLHLWIDSQADVPQQFSFAVTNVDAPARFFRLIPTPPDPPPIRILLLGDSMVADCCGWGIAMPSFFKPSALVINYAQAWTSTKVFLQSAEFDKMLLIQPNYVIMEYAYSDGGLDPDRGSPPLEFAENLRTLVRTIRSFNGIPILMTLHANRAWDSAGNLIPSDHVLNQSIKQVAAEMNTGFIDLYKLTFDLFSRLGQKGCDFFLYDPARPEDGMHVSQKGAAWISQLIAKQLPDEVGQYMVGVLDPPPKL